MPRFAANLSMMFNELPFLDRFEAAAKAGFDAVEFLFPYDFEKDEIAERLKAHGLSQALFNLPPGDWQMGERGLAALPDRRPDFRKALELAVDYGVALGVPHMHVMAGNISPDDPAAHACFRDNLRLAAEIAGSAGIGVLIEPLNRRDNPGYFLDDFEKARQIIEDLAHPAIRLQFDLYHRQILHGDVMRGLETMMPVIGHIQIASVPHRHEPGTGELDDFTVLAALDRLGYAGYVGCEYRPAGQTLDGLGWLAKIRDDQTSAQGSVAMQQRETRN